VEFDHKNPIRARPTADHERDVHASENNRPNGRRENTKAVEAADTIAVKCLLGDLTWLMNIYDMLKACDRKLMLHIPSKIWLDNSTPEQAYADYEKQVRLTAKLKKLGIEVKYKRNNGNIA
jgi:molybdenum cofactor biosynthesis enzyme